MNTATKLGIVSLLALSAMMLYAGWLLPQFGSPVMAAGSFINQTGAQASAAANIVCAIVLDYRGYDTLGEATVLLAAIAGFVAVLKVKKE